MTPENEATTKCRKGGLKEKNIHEIKKTKEKNKIK
jgi:hypothetical protein